MDLRQIHDSVIAGDAPAVEELVQQALSDSVPAGEIILGSLIPAMTEVGDSFGRQEIYVSEMLLAARAMKSALRILKPLLLQGELEPAGCVLMGTVKGDLHDIGKNLVCTMLEGAGFQVIDLGIDVPPGTFVDAVRERKPDLVGMSALLTTTMAEMRSTIEALREAGLRNGVKIMVGGAPVTQAYADQIGADGYAPDAGTSVRRARRLLSIE